MNGVTFGSKHSYKDWGLILKSRPVISSPSPKTIYIDIPATDGSLDLTESLTGDVKFNNRTIKFEFAVIEARKRWTALYSEVMNYLHGQNMRVILDEDADYYYTGRFQVNEWKSDKRTATIVIEGTVEPYKLEKYSSIEDWEWDSFNFETGQIRDYRNIRLDGTPINYVINCNRKLVIPKFIVQLDEEGTEFIIRWNGGTWQSKKVTASGTYVYPDIKLTEGQQNIYLNGKGYISIDYRGGSL